MKNKHGIEIRIGDTASDKYGCNCGRVGTVVGIHNDNVWLYYESGRKYTTVHSSNLKIHKSVCFGDMSEWDIVTDEQKRDYNKPKEAEAFANVSKI